jgi:hypothetical protein
MALTRRHDPSVRALCSLGSDGRRARGDACLGHATLELRRLPREPSPPRLELEEDRLGRLAGEPQLAQRRVVSEPFGRHRRNPRVEQLLETHDRELAHDLLR